MILMYGTLGVENKVSQEKHIINTQLQECSTHLFKFMKVESWLWCLIADVSHLKVEQGYLAK